MPESPDITKLSEQLMVTDSMFLACSKTYSKDKFSRKLFWSILMMHLVLLESVCCALTVVNNHNNLGSAECFLPNSIYN